MADPNEKQRRKNLRDVVLGFTPAWFAFNMGTGAVSLLFHSFPYGNETAGIHIISLIFLILNLVLFWIFMAISAARYTLFPDVWSLMIHHPVQSMFTGTQPMGAFTIITAAIAVVVQYYGVGGVGLVYVCWAFWWVHVAVSALCCWGMVMIMSTGQMHSLEKMTAVWLLPVVTVIVASSCGGVLAPALMPYSQGHAMLTATLAIFLVSVGLSLALMMLTIYLLRLIVHGLPAGGTVLSVFLPLGPTGQAGYAILLIGEYYKEYLPVGYGVSNFLNTKDTGVNIHAICVSIAFVLWCLCTMWVIFAFLKLFNVIVVHRTRFGFGTPFFGIIFPNGVYANLTIAFASLLDSQFFRVWGAIYAIFTFTCWTYVAWNTLKMVYTRAIFEAPCLAEIDLSRVTRSNGTARTQ